MKNTLILAALSMGVALSVQAAPITFFGEDITGSTAGDPANAQAAFLATLSGGVGTEDFETAVLPTTTFAGSTGNITASLTGGGTSIESGANLGGRFPTSGSNFVETGNGGDFNLSFSSAISAFGFFGTDIGDIGNSLTLRMTDINGVISDLAVGNTVNSASGSVLYFGFIDTANSYTNILFVNEPGGGDIFGFDDLTIGDLAQITNPPPVPLPAAGWLLLGALGGMGALRRKAKRKA